MFYRRFINIFAILLAAMTMLAAQSETGTTVLPEEYPDFSCICAYHTHTAGTLLLSTGPSGRGAAAYPGEAVLLSNYPNPFNPSTTIRFELPYVSNVRVSIYNLRGQEVVRLGEGTMPRGYHHLVWDGRDRNGRSVSGGIYIARLTTPDYAKSIRLALLK